MSYLNRLLVIGGNGFLGSAVCKAALARGMQVTSISQSGAPFRTPKGHSPAWTSEVNWQAGNALNPETYSHILPSVTAVVHTIGTLFEDTRYKAALKEGNLPALLDTLVSNIAGGGPSSNPLADKLDNPGSYELLNRDAAVRTCEAFISSTPSTDIQRPRVFVYVSAEDIFRPFIPARYIETKREAETEIEYMMSQNPAHRPVYIRPSLIYHPHFRPLTSPIAALLDLSATLHSQVPQGLPTPSALLRSLSRTLPVTSYSQALASSSSLDSMANAMTIPPIHVDHVAEAICISVEQSRDDGTNALALMPDLSNDSNAPFGVEGVAHRVIIARDWRLQPGTRGAAAWGWGGGPSEDSTIRCARQSITGTGQATRPGVHTALYRHRRQKACLLHRLPGILIATVVLGMSLSSALFSTSFRPKVVRTCWRGFRSTATANKALPFSLHNVRGGAVTQDVPYHDEGRFLRMLMFGKPGAGKGTLTARLVKKYDVLSLSTGDLLRQHIAERTEVGRMAEEIVATGGLLPDDIMLKVVSTKLDMLHNKHWILDGFPRTVGQGQLLDEHLQQQGCPLSLVVNLNVPDEVILSRISDRWVHLPSGRVYNLSYNPPKVAGHDDETGEPLTKRPDDNPETFARRLDKFYASTSPLLDYYLGNPGNARIVTLSGSTSDEIWPQLENSIRSNFPNVRERTESREQKRRTSLSEAVLGRSDRNSANRVGRLVRDY
ncbi:uncharacterized protein FIBRA_06804 [Fibroporia radiculosa]|uniref:GTP:AMP phosphotransferase, mitochondrial n=1 Tax=Fibroporia radiculosa TaxID=599839 RepID=J4GTJ7_9APHY|nr:uncharacterized protein FIBRA_06804 [Fibroporia radiculosa]CCM04620.1 predicted protein [Fibroporia radiculosa]